MTHCCSDFRWHPSLGKSRGFKEKPGLSGGGNDLLRAAGSALWSSHARLRSRLLLWHRSLARSTAEPVWRFLLHTGRTELTHRGLWEVFNPSDCVWLHIYLSAPKDTVVALQALAKYGAATYSAEGSTTVTVTSLGGLNKEFTVDQRNRLLYQEEKLSEVPGEYTVRAQGQSCVLAQVRPTTGWAQDNRTPWGQSQGQKRTWGDVLDKKRTGLLWIKI